MAHWNSFAALGATGFMQLAWAKQVNFDLDPNWQKGVPDGNVGEMIFIN